MAVCCDNGSSGWSGYTDVNLSECTQMGLLRLGKHVYFIFVVTIIASFSKKKNVDFTFCNKGEQQVLLLGQ